MTSDIAPDGNIGLFLALAKSLRELILYCLAPGTRLTKELVTIEQGRETAVKQELALRVSAGK